LATFAVSLALSSMVSATSFRESPELEKVFQNNGVVGTFVLFNPSADSDTMLVWNEERAKKRFIPASTFKIANTVIGLQYGAVKNVDEVLPYGGKPLRVKEWERDMGLREAIKMSNVAIYQELARRIGLERMRDGVKRLNYGNMDIGKFVDQFWLDGPLEISAVEQTEFLNRLLSRKLRIKEDVIEAVKEITLQEKTDAYALHAKTGWCASTKPQIGWWVGWVERDNQIFPFALNIDMQSDEDAAKRVPVGRECLKALGML
jgi:beta-lactamase class D